MVAVNNGSLVIPTKNQLVPAEGPKVVPLTFDFTANPSYLVDLQSVMSRYFISVIQTLFFDTTSMTQPVTVTPSISSQPLILPPGSQGYLPCLVPTNEAKLTVASADTSHSCSIFLLNFPIAPAVWSGTGQAFLFDVNGSLEVSDVALDACILNNKVGVQDYQLGSGNTAVPIFGGRVLAAEATLHFGTAVSATLFAGSPRAFIENLSIQLTGDSYLAAPGIFTVSLYENVIGNLIWQGKVALPGAAPTMPQQNYNLVSFAKMNYLSQIDASNIVLDCSNVDFKGYVVCHATYGVTSAT